VLPPIYTLTYIWTPPLNHFFLINTDIWFILMEINEANVHMSSVNVHEVKQDDHPVQPCWGKYGHTNKSTFDYWLHCFKRWEVSIYSSRRFIKGQLTITRSDSHDDTWGRWCVCVRIYKQQKLFKHVAHKHIWHINTACITGMFAYW